MIDAAVLARRPAAKERRPILPPRQLHRLVLTFALWVVSIIAGPLASAASAAPPWVGVWRGTVGTAPVQVCLQHADYADIGAYFYLRHLAIISLGTLDAKNSGHSKPGAAPVWSEASFSDKAANGPLWHITTASAGTLQGIWSDGAKTLPITLARVPMAAAAEDDDGAKPCGNKAFSLPRYTKPAVTTRPAKVTGVSYTRVLIDPGKQFEDSNSETFQLAGTSPAIRRVNAELHKTVPTGPDDAAYFTCSMAALAQNGLDGDASSTLAPLIITANWMVVEDTESDDCGGPHPNAGVQYQTWDLHSGVKLDLNTWFTAAAMLKTPYDTGTKDAFVTIAFTPAFRKLIDAAYPRRDADCMDAERDQDTWDPHLSAKGIAFTPEFPHVVAACAEDAVIPFARLAPYLNATGKAQLARFRSEMGGAK